MSIVQQCLDAEAKNIVLREKLSELRGEPKKDKQSVETEGKLRAIELMKGELELKQMMEQKELTVKRLQEEIKAHKLEMRAVGEAVQEAKSVGQPPWEVTGYKTVPYKDSFHTGLMKRTPTGGYFTS